MTIGKSITYVSKDILIKMRDEIDRMIQNYIEYEYGFLIDDKNYYKYSCPWEEIKRGNDYY